MVASGKARFYPSALMRKLVRVFIRIYQVTLSPLLAAIAGPGLGCRFEPTCSEYFAQSVEAYGIFRGGWLGLKRFARCQPWGGHGHDSVPLFMPAAELANRRA